MSRVGLAAVCGYVATIFAANWLIVHVGIVSVGFGLMAPAGVYAVGVAFTLRDIVQRTLGRGATVAAILVGAGSPVVPQPLIDQLAVGGRLLCPVGDRERQEVVLVTRDISGVRRTVVADARFVPLVGTHGWVDGDPA